MLDDRFDDRLRHAARDYNQPPETPRDLMWERIVAARAGQTEKTEKTDKAEKTQPQIIPFRPRRLLRPLVGIAALLAVGIGLGRLTAPRPEPAAPVASVGGPSGRVDPSPRVSEVAYRLATTEHLGQSEAFLTLFRSSLQQPGTQRLASATARQLLATNRLLLDSPAGSDRQTRLLLQDLELVLAQIAQLSARSSSPDLDLITEGLEDTGVMSRLRTAVPSGTSTTQGVL